MNVVNGKIKDLVSKETKSGKFMYIVTMHDGSKYSGFDKAPERLEHAFKSGENVEVQFKVNGVFKNIIKVNYPVVEKQTELKDSVPDKLDDLGNYVEYGEEIMVRCYSAVANILGRNPEGTEVACVNSLFIFVSNRVKR